MAKVLIIGGGLSGLSSAVYLLDKGITPHIFEKNQYLGGRTSSWVQDGMEMESGLHRVLGFYEEFPKLLEKCKLKLEDIAIWLDEIEIKPPIGQSSAVFAISLKRKPIQTILDALGNNNFISFTEKLTLMRFLSVGLIHYFKDPLEMDSHSIKEYARRSGLSENIIFRIIEPLSSGLFFLPPEKYSAYVFFGTVGPYLKRIHNFGEAAFKGGMTEVLCNPIAEFIINKGGIVDKGTEVEKLIVDKNEKVIGIEINNEEIYADHVILASDIGSAKEIIKRSFKKSDKFDSLLKLKTMPAVTVQFELEKPLNKTDRVTFSPGTVWGCYAEQSRTSFKTKKGRLSLILSNPEAYIDKKPEEILVKIKEDAKRLDLDLSNIIRYKVVYLDRDFYSLKPGNESLKPLARTRIDGLTLAGDYTKQKYLATMEGAVYSGRLAAEVVSSEINR